LYSACTPPLSLSQSRTKISHIITPPVLFCLLVSVLTNCGNFWPVSLFRRAIPPHQSEQERLPYHGKPSTVPPLSCVSTEANLSLGYCLIVGTITIIGAWVYGWVCCSSGVKAFSPPLRGSPQDVRLVRRCF